MVAYKNLLRLASILLLLLCMENVQAQQLSNHYSMKLTDDGQGGYRLLQADKYAKAGMDLNVLTDALVPYECKTLRLNSKLYRGVETIDYIYKKENGYELKLSVDKAISKTPTPFVIFLHGGGWRTGNNGSSRTLSQYLAKQSGITGVRVSYTLAPQPGASIEVTIQDVLDALKFVQQHAKELNVIPDKYGFLGTSAGAHLAAVGAMKTQAKVLVGYSGIYDLEKAKITAKTKDEQRKAYFRQLRPEVLSKVSPINMIPKKNIPASFLVCGTYDVTVECDQSKMFSDAIRSRGGIVDLSVYPYYDHNLASKSSDKMEEIFFKTVDFLVKYLK